MAAKFPKVASRLGQLTKLGAVAALPTLCAPQAIEALSKFYAKNALLQKEDPEYTTDENKPPEAAAGIVQ